MSGTTEYVTWSSCNLPVFKSVSHYTYKASECKRAVIRLHCATSKSSLWYMGYVPCGGAFERPRIYRTSTLKCSHQCTVNKTIQCTGVTGVVMDTSTLNYSLSKQCAHEHVHTYSTHPKTNTGSFNWHLSIKRVVNWE